MTTPDGVTGLVFWLKADQITGLNDGDPVSTWEDQSTYGFDVTGSGSARPTYKTSIINSLPIVRFDGTDDFMSVGTNTALEPANYSIFGVASSSATAGRIVAYSAGTDSATFGRGYAMTFGSPNYFGTKGSGDGSEETVTATRISPDPTYIDVHYDGSILEAFEYGVFNANNTPDTQGISYTNSTGLFVGKLDNGAGGNFFFNGDVGEVFIYDRRVSSSDQEALQAYLFDKWFATNTPGAVNRPLAIDVDEEDGTRLYQTVSKGGTLYMERYLISSLGLVSQASFGAATIAQIDARTYYLQPYTPPFYSTSAFGDYVFAFGRWDDGSVKHLALSTNGGVTFGSNLGDASWGSDWLGAFFATDTNTYYAFLNGGSPALWRSLNGGTSWTSLSSLPFDVDYAAVDQHPNGRIIIANRSAAAQMAAYADSPYSSWTNITGSPSLPTGGGGIRSMFWIP